jgi:hypothetical protein
MTVICQLYEAGWRLSVSYMRQVGGCLHVCVYSVCYMRQHGDYLSVT